MYLCEGLLSLVNFGSFSSGSRCSSSFFFPSSNRTFSSNAALFFLDSPSGFGCTASVLLLGLNPIFCVSSLNPSSSLQATSPCFRACIATCLFIFDVFLDHSSALSSFRATSPFLLQAFSTSWAFFVGAYLYIFIIMLCFLYLILYDLWFVLLDFLLILYFPKCLVLNS